MKITPIREFVRGDTSRIWELLNELGGKVNELVNKSNAPQTLAAAGVRGFASASEIPLTSFASQNMGWTTNHGGGIIIPADGIYQVSALGQFSGSTGMCKFSVYCYRGSQLIDLLYVSADKWSGLDMYLAIPAANLALQKGDQIHLSKSDSTIPVYGNGTWGTRIDIRLLQEN